MHLALLGLWHGRNYGAVFTSYALQQFLKQIDNIVTLLDIADSDINKDETTPFRQFLQNEGATTFPTGREAAYSLNNAIDAQKYAFNEKIRNQVRRNMDWEGHWVIGDVARFSPQKNHLGLLSIFKEVLGKEPKALLVLVGEKTGLYEEVKQKAENLGISHAVQFLGTRNDIPQLLQGMDVYCSPSLYEGLSVSMVEAQAAGLRVVTSDKVPQQISIIPNLLSFIPLSETKNKWLDALLSYYDRANTFNQITTAGFDIDANAAWLQDFYAANILS